MDLLIKIDENGLPQRHPRLRSNLQLAYPDGGFEGSNVPSGWLVFERVPEPILGPYQKFDDSKGSENCDAWEHNGLEYKVVDGKVKDVWNIIDMTDEEKKAKQDEVKAEWAARDASQAPASWTFDEEKCEYVAPVELPFDAGFGVDYIWNETDRTWDKYTPKQEA